jgi:hypothetical protein
MNKTTIKMPILRISSMREYKEIISDIEDIDFVYISIGGKINETFITRQVYGSKTTTRDRTNSINHLVPNFLKYRDNKKILIVSLDQYSNEENYRMNRNLVSQSLEDKMQFVFFDTFCTQEFLIEFMEVTIEFLKSNKIPANNFMICNFVRFVNLPNPMEKQSESEIPSTIHLFLLQEDVDGYKDRFYQWYGYGIYTYNLIYNYKNYNQLSQLSEFNLLFQKFIKSKFHFNDDYDIIGITKGCKLWTYSIDITSYIHSTESMSLSLREQYDQMFQHTSTDTKIPMLLDTLGQTPLEK